MKAFILLLSSLFFQEHKRQKLCENSFGYSYNYSKSCESNCNFNGAAGNIIGLRTGTKRTKHCCQEEDMKSFHLCKRNYQWLNANEGTASCKTITMSCEQGMEGSSTVSSPFSSSNCNCDGSVCTPFTVTVSGTDS